MPSIQATPQKLPAKSATPVRDRRSVASPKRGVEKAPKSERIKEVLKIAAKHGRERGVLKAKQPVNRAAIRALDKKFKQDLAAHKDLLKDVEVVRSVKAVSQRQENLVRAGTVIKETKRLARAEARQKAEKVIPKVTRASREGDAVAAKEPVPKTQLQRYLKRHQKLIERNPILAKRLEEVRVKAAVQGRETVVNAHRDAQRIKEALSGRKIDSKQVGEVLQGKSKEEVAALVKAYDARYGESLSRQLSARLSGSAREHALSVVQGKAVAADAAKLSNLLEQEPVNQEEVVKLVKKYDQQAYNKLAKQFNDRHAQRFGDRDLDAVLSKSLSPEKLAEVIDHKTRQTPQRTVEALQKALSAEPPDVKKIERALKTLSDQQLQAVRESYQKATGRELVQDLRQQIEPKHVERVVARAEGDRQSAAALARVRQEAGSTVSSSELQQAPQVQQAQQVQQSSQRLARDGLQQQAIAEAAEKVPVEKMPVDKVPAEKSAAAKVGVRTAETLRSLATQNKLDQRFDAVQAAEGGAETVNRVFQQMNQRFTYETSGRLNTVVNAFSPDAAFYESTAFEVEGHLDHLNEGYLRSSDKEREQDLWTLSEVQAVNQRKYRKDKNEIAHSTGLVAAIVAGLFTALLAHTQGVSWELSGLMGAGAAGAAYRFVSSGIRGGTTKAQQRRKAQREKLKKVRKLGRSR